MIAWERVQAGLDTLVPATDGFSIAKRGIVTLDDGSRCFVKIGVDDETRAWADHEVRVYRWLEKIGYPHIPALLSVTDGGFAIEDLSHCSFENTWDDAKLDTVLAAMEELATIPQRPGVDAAEAGIRRSSIPNGWQLLLDDQASLERMQTKLSHLGDRVSRAAVQDYLALTKHFATQGQDLVHDDVRADNLGYDTQTGKVYIVDWNWCAIGNRSVDQLGFLVSVQKSGYDVRAKHTARIDAAAALYLAGFWFYHAVQPIWEGGKSSLRNLQLESGNIAFGWARDEKP